MARRTRWPDAAAAASRLARLLGSLPLAPTHAAAYIARRRLSFVDSLDVWAGEREKVLARHGTLPRQDRNRLIAVVAAAAG